MPPESYSPSPLPGIVCPYCGARNRTDWASCAFCGRPVQSSPPAGPTSPEQDAAPTASTAPISEAAGAPRQCAWCGAANQAEAARCVTCGAAFPTPESEAAFQHELDIDLAVYRARVHTQDFEREERLHRWQRRLIVGRGLLKLFGPFV